MKDFSERFEKYLSGAMRVEEREAFEAEILTRPELADELYADTSTIATLETAARAHRERSVIARSPSWWRQGVWRWAVPATAVAAVAVLLVARAPQRPEGPAVFRGAAEKPEVVSPVGDLDMPPTLFVWRRYSNAALYRFELFDPSSRRLFTSTTSDTSIIVDSSVVDIPDHGYWVLTPLDDVQSQKAVGVTTWFQVRQ